VNGLDASVSLHTRDVIQQGQNTASKILLTSRSSAALFFRLIEVKILKTDGTCDAATQDCHPRTWSIRRRLVVVEGYSSPSKFRLGSGGSSEPANIPRGRRRIYWASEGSYFASQHALEQEIWDNADVFLFCDCVALTMKSNSGPSTPLVYSYGLAIVFVALALLTSLALQHSFGNPFWFIFSVAVILSTWFGRIRWGDSHKPVLTWASSISAQCEDDSRIRIEVRVLHLPTLLLSSSPQQSFGPNVVSCAPDAAFSLLSENRAHRPMMRARPTAASLQTPPAIRDLIALHTDVLDIGARQPLHLVGPPVGVAPYFVLARATHTIVADHGCILDVANEDGSRPLVIDSWMLACGLYEP
jgi:hypothetical protein